MKNILFIILLIPLGLYGQIKVAPGLKGGILVSQLKLSKSNKNWEYGYGPNVGMTYTAFYNKLYFAIEPAFASREFEIVSHQKFVLNNLEMPIIIGYTPIKNKLRLGASGGISPTYLSIHKNVYEDGHEEFKKFNLDIVGGGVIGYDISNDFMMDLNIRYGKGIIGNKYNYLSVFLNFIIKV